MRPIYLLGFLLLTIFSGCSKEDAPAPSSNQAPEVPFLLKPLNNEICTPTSLLFEWRASVDPDGDNVSYQLEISRDQNFSGNIQTLRIYLPNIELTMEPGITFFWRVKAMDSKSNLSSYTEIRTFFTEPSPEYNNIPNTPVIVSPGHTTFVGGSKVRLEWTATDPDGDALRFNIYLGTENPPNLIKEDHENTSIELDIQSGKTYYWKIEAKDQFGTKAIGEVWNFRT